MIRGIEKYPIGIDTGARIETSFGDVVIVESYKGIGASVTWPTELSAETFVERMLQEQSSPETYLRQAAVFTSTLDSEAQAVDLNQLHSWVQQCTELVDIIKIERKNMDYSIIWQRQALDNDTVSQLSCVGDISSPEELGNIFDATAAGSLQPLKSQLFEKIAESLA